MDLEDFKSIYQNAGSEKTISKKQLELMEKIKNHPVLGKIKRQLILETCLYAILLFVYYDFFDGHQKAFVWNLLLVVAIALLLIHNFLGFKLVKSPIQGNSLKASLKEYAMKIRNFSRVSISSRILAFAAMMMFFLSGAEWQNNSYLIILGIISMMGIQVYFLNQLWGKRVKIIQNAYEDFIVED